MNVNQQRKTWNALRWSVLALITLTVLAQPLPAQVLSAGVDFEPPLDAGFATRIKDLASVQGTSSLRLFGMGLVVGLAGTGDGQGTEFTVQALVNMLTKRGITVRADDVRVNNVAAVMLTADLPPFARRGSRIDVTVSTVGDCKSLEGGTLLYSVMQAGDEEVYATAQGSLTIGGYNVEASGGTKIRKNHAATARLTSGGNVEQDFPGSFEEDGIVRLTLWRPDFTNASRIARAVDDHFGVAGLATPVDLGTVEVDLSQMTGLYRNFVNLIAELEQIPVRDDTAARVVINERTGTIVSGADMKLKRVVLSHGSLAIYVRGQSLADKLGMPGTSQDTVTVRDEVPRTQIIEEGTTLGEFVDQLARVTSTRDIIAILQALREAGALNAEIVLM